MTVGGIQPSLSEELEGDPLEVKGELPTSEDTIISHVNHSDEADGMKKILEALVKRGGSQNSVELVLRFVEDPELAEKIKTYLNVEKVMRSELVGADERLQQAEALSLFDGLTGLGNRRFLAAALDSEVSRFDRKKFPVEKPAVSASRETAEEPKKLFALMFDVDDFKSVNDAYGHPFEDAVLKKLSDILKTVFKRKTDVVVRYGGEEFCVLAWCQNEDDVIQLANKVRESFGNEVFLFGKNGTTERVKRTISAGISAYRTDMGADGLIGLADDALYVAKGKKGEFGKTNPKNRVVLADESDPLYSEYQKYMIMSGGYG